MVPDQEIVFILAGILGDEPTPRDILCGQDTRAWENRQHDGNLFYNQIIQYHAQHYFPNLPRSERIRLSRQVYGMLKDSGARFLRPLPRNADGEKGWFEIEESEARDKVSSSLRNASKALHPELWEEERLRKQRAREYP